MGAAIFVVLHAERPAASGARFLLHGVDRAVLGRGPVRSKRLLAEDALRIDLPDGRISVEHACLERAMGHWAVVDLGSKNGVFVNGQRVDRKAVADGDWIEIGHTFLRFWAGIDAASDFDAALGPADPLRTLAPAFQSELDKLRQVADKNVPVLLRGETGSGKELLARSLHALSRRPGPFVAINCGAIPPNLVEATLFGHRRGAFSGADDDRPGVVASADRGTLLLDEVGDLPPSQQAALLRVLQEKEVVPVGDTRPHKVDVRIVAATNQDLAQMVRERRFRADLFYRLNVFPIALPSLRERKEDIPLLVQHFVRKFACRMNKEVSHISEEAMTGQAT